MKITPQKKKQRPLKSTTGTILVEDAAEKTGQHQLFKPVDDAKI
jgi:hypothetical protein